MNPIEMPPVDLAGALARIEARLMRIEGALEPAATIADKLPALIATAVDTIDDQAARLGDVEQRVGALTDVLERLTRPATLASLKRLVDMAEQAPQLLAVATDVFDETMSEAAAQGLELSQVVDELKRLVFGLLRLTTSSELKSALESGMLAPRALGTLGKVAGALVEVSDEPPARVGALGALRALRDRDVQRALGFLLQVAQSFGRALAEDTATTKQLSD